MIPGFQRKMTSLTPYCTLLTSKHLNNFDKTLPLVTSSASTIRLEAEMLKRKTLLVLYYRKTSLKDHTITISSFII